MRLPFRNSTPEPTESVVGVAAGRENGADSASRLSRVYKSISTYHQVGNNQFVTAVEPHSHCFSRPDRPSFAAKDVVSDGDNNSFAVTESGCYKKRKVYSYDRMLGLGALQPVVPPLLLEIRPSFQRLLL